MKELYAQHLRGTGIAAITSINTLVTRSHRYVNKIADQERKQTAWTRGN